MTSFWDPKMCVFNVSLYIPMKRENRVFRPPVEISQVAIYTTFGSGRSAETRKTRFCIIAKNAILVFSACPESRDVMKSGCSLT